MAELISVKSNTGDNRVALWERNPAHPDGEIFVYGARPVIVAKTRAVLSALGAGRLVEAGTVAVAETTEPPDSATGAENPPDSAPVDAISGIGTKTRDALGKAGIFTVGDLRKADADNLTVDGVSAEQLRAWQEGADG